jgi:hypothetical protein
METGLPDRVKARLYGGTAVDMASENFVLLNIQLDSV